MAMRVYYPKCRVNLYMVGEDTSLGAIMPIHGIAPRKVRIINTPTNQADRYEVELDGHYFPADDSMLRSTLVEVYLGHTADMAGELEYGPANRSILGHVDNVRRSMSEGAKVYLTGRDYTALFLDAKIKGARIKLGRTLEVIVGELVALVGGAAAMTVVNSTGAPTPTVPAGVGPKGESYAGKHDDRVWDVIQELAKRVGLLCVVRVDEVIIMEPRTVSPLDPTAYPVFLEGQNCKKLETERAYDDRDLPNIRVKAVDPKTFKTIEATWPLTPLSSTTITKTGEKTSRSTKEDYHEFIIEHPAPTVAILREVGRRVFEGWRARQLSIKFETTELVVSAQATGARLALLPATDKYEAAQIRNGTPLRLEVSTQTRHILERDQTPEAKELELRRRGFRESVAAALASRWTELARTLYVSQATHTFDHEAGYSLAVETVAALEV